MNQNITNNQKELPQPPQDPVKDGIVVPQQPEAKKD